MPTLPRVSVVIPCFNAERWIGAAVLSALSQTHTNCEVIVVDDGSTDRSRHVLESFGSALRVITGSNGGPSTARNRGLSAASGEWVQFLDADDLLHPEKIRLSLDAHRRYPTVDYVWAPHTSVDDSFRLQEAQPAFEACGRTAVRLPPTHEALLASYTPWAAMFRRSFLADRVGCWNEDLKGWEDLEYHARIAAQLPVYACLETPLYFYRQHDGERVGHSSRTAANIRREIECLTASQAILEGSDVPRDVWRSILWPFYVQLARASATVGDTKTFVQFLRAAAELRASPKFRLKCYLATLAAYVVGARVSGALTSLSLPSQGRQ